MQFDRLKPYFLCLYSVSLLGCNAALVQKKSQTWEQSQVMINSGLRVEQLLNCTPAPVRKATTGDSMTLTYGVKTKHPYGSTWCVLDIVIKSGKTHSFQRYSANPGGITDGSQTCALIMDRCVGDGSLLSESQKLNQQVTFIDKQSDIEAIKAGYTPPSAGATRDQSNSARTEYIGMEKANSSRAKGGSIAELEIAYPSAPSSSGDDCVSNAPKCANANKRAMSLLETVKLKWGMSDSARVSYCTAKIGAEVNSFCASEFRAQGRTRCVPPLEDAAEQFRVAAVRNRNLMNDMSARETEKACEWQR